MMDDKSYLRALRHRLRRLDRDTRENILAELRSAAGEGNQRPLEERFGPVDALADRYLADTPEHDKRNGMLSKAWRWVGLPALGLIGAAVLLMLAVGWWFSRDEFDYSDPMAAAIDQRIWQRAPILGPLTIDVQQARVVIYWHDKAQLAWHCKRGASLQPDAEGPRLVVARDDCLLRLPTTAARLTATQTNAVLIEPASELSVELWQASLRIADSAPSAVSVETDFCEVDPAFQQNGGLSLLSISGSMCKVQPYS